MKQFKQDSQNNLICEECGKLCKSKISLIKHIMITHKLELKFYYDKWLKDEGEGLCKICNTPTLFKGFGRYYQDTCCKECKHKYFKIVCLEKYGTTSPLGNRDIINKGKATCEIKYNGHPTRTKAVQDKYKKTCLERYGVENTFQNEDVKDKIKNTNIERYGVENPNHTKEVRDKIKNTCNKKYGVDFALQDKGIRDKCKSTMLLKYGVEHQSQNEEIHLRQMKTGKKIKQFKDTDIWYQGTYELDFLTKYYHNFSDIQRATSIKYIINEQNKFYHPDFYIPSLNLIVEIKSSWILKLDLEIKEKEKTTIANGFNYILIINKNYDIFNELYM